MAKIWELWEFFNFIAVFLHYGKVNATKRNVRFPFVNSEMKKGPAVYGCS